MAMVMTATRGDTGTAARTTLNAAVSVAAIAIGLITAPELLLGFSIAAVIGIACEVLAPGHPRRRTRHDVVTDLTHAFGDRSMIVPLVAAGLGVLGPVVETIVPSPIRIAVGDAPIVVAVVLTLLATDLANYGIHRALHRVDALWRFHAVHHSSERLDWLATSRVHPIDLGINIVAVTLPTYALGEVAMAPWLLTFFFVQPFVIHANARIRLPRLARVLVTPSFHHWHHAAEDEAHDRNFGMFLSIWDRMFGTALDRDELPARYGIGRPELADADFVGHLVRPFAA